MAVGSLLALLDDIATILDDVSVMTKVAAKKTAGVLGDDLALNAQQVTGVSAERELPVVWAVAKGSFINKLILVPAALAISYFIPWLITPLLMLGGAFLCFEGFEKIAHKWFHHEEISEATHTQEIHDAVKNPQLNFVELEKEKIQGAIRTDFILSAEIIVIALGTVANADFLKQFSVVASIAIIMTIGVYGLVAGIVKMDDAGLFLMQKKGNQFLSQLLRKIGQGLLSFAPFLMRALSVLGTAAMFLVGGSIIGHGIPAVHHISETLVQSIALPSTLGSVAKMLMPVLVDALVGILVGAGCVLGWVLLQKIVKK